MVHAGAGSSLRSAPHRFTLGARRAEFCCNGTIVEDTELGHVIQLQGDQRKNASTFLTSNNIAKKDLIKVHGAHLLALQSLAKKRLYCVHPSVTLLRSCCFKQRILCLTGSSGCCCAGF